MTKNQLVTKDEKMAATLLFGGITFLVFAFGLGYGLLNTIFIGNIVAGIFAFIIRSNGYPFRDWNLFKTTRLICIVGLGSISLGFIASTNKPIEKWA